MAYEEWSDLATLIDKDNPFSTLYELSSGDKFYIEPAFYSQLQGIKAHFPQSYCLIINEMNIIVKNNHNVIFTSDFENPLTKKDGYIYCEIEDITNKLGLIVDNNSRGSDYGD